MLDFEVQRCTRRCAATDREFKPGEVVFSALVPRGAEVVRQDFAADAWQGPPEKAIGWWKGRVPDGVQPKQSWAPNDVMLDYFQRLADQPEKADACYVLALLLIRRRVLKLEEGTTDTGDELSVFCARNEKVYRIPAVLPDETRVQQIQAELRAALSGAIDLTAPAPAPALPAEQSPDVTPLPVDEPAPSSMPPPETAQTVVREPSQPSVFASSTEADLSDALPSLAGLLAEDHGSLTDATRQLDAS